MLVGNVAQGLVRFDAGGNIVGGLAERWNVSDDGLSYIFRLAATEWPDGRRSPLSRWRSCSSGRSAAQPDPLKDALGAIDDIVAMTDRVIEIRLVAPRPNLLSLLAQPSSRSFAAAKAPGRSTSTPTGSGGELRLTREIVCGATRKRRQREEVCSHGAAAQQARRRFRGRQGRSGARRHLRRFAAFSTRQTAAREPALRSGLGAVRTGSGAPGGALDKPDVRPLAGAGDRSRQSSSTRWACPGSTARATLLEPGLDGVPAPSPRRGSACRSRDRLAGARAPDEPAVRQGQSR